MGSKNNPSVFSVSEEPTNDLAIEDTDTHLGQALPFGAVGFTNGLFVVENSLDQAASVLIQGRNPDCDNWQTAAAATEVAPAADATIPITAPWGELRVSVTCAIAPTSDSIKVSFICVRGSAPGSGEGTIIANPDSGEIALADGLSNTPNMVVDKNGAAVVNPAFVFVYNGTTWDRMPGTAATGQVVAARFIDESGTPYGVKHVDNKPRVSAVPYLYDIAEGNIAGHTAFFRFGHNEDVAAALETVWHGSNLRPYLASAERLQITSDDVDDDGDPVGDGARTVTIIGLDGNYDMLEETVTMNGVGNVLTDASFLRVCSLVTATAGATGANEGTITASNNADTAVLAMMTPGENMSHSACLTVPDGYAAYIVQFTMGEASTKGCEIALWSRTEGGLWTKGQGIVLLDSAIPISLAMPPPFASRTDIEIRAEAVLAGANVTAGFEGWIEL